MKTPLELCAHCHRHSRSEAGGCPFCSRVRLDAPPRRRRGGWLAASLLGLATCAPFALDDAVAQAPPLEEVIPEAPEGAQEPPEPEADQQDATNPREASPEPCVLCEVEPGMLEGIDVNNVKIGGDVDPPGSAGYGGPPSHHGPGLDELMGDAPKRPRSRVKYGEPMIEGEYDPKSVKRVTHSRRRALERCHQMAIAKDPDASGSLTVGWTIGVNGRVTASWNGANTMGETTTQKCVTSQIRRWRFPIPTEGEPIDVTMTFSFRVE